MSVLILCIPSSARPNTAALTSSRTPSAATQHRSLCLNPSLARQSHGTRPLDPDNGVKPSSTAFVGAAAPASAVRHGPDFGARQSFPCTHALGDALVARHHLAQHIHRPQPRRRRWRGWQRCTGRQGPCGEGLHASGTAIRGPGYCFPVSYCPVTAGRSVRANTTQRRDRCWKDHHPRTHVEAPPLVLGYTPLEED